MNSIDVLDSWDLGIVGITLMLYIVGKVWMYHRIEDTPNKNKKSKSKLIKRGTEWPE